MNLVYDSNVLSEFESVKDNDEYILWIEKPRFFPYIMKALGLGVGAVVWAGVWYTIVIENKAELGNFYLLFGLLPLAAFVFDFLRKLFSYINTRYAYTNKRIMMRSGFIGTGLKSIDYDKLSEIEVTVNLVEKVFHVGTIKFFSGRTKTDDGSISKLYDHWEAIPNPYETFRQVKQLSSDFKTKHLHSVR